MKVKLEDVCKNESSNLMQKDVINRNGHYPIYGAAGKIGNVDFYHQMKSYVAVVKDGAGIGRTMLLPAKSSVIGTMQYLVPCEVVIPQYLYYVVKHMHLEKYYTGATIPHIYFKDYKKEVFNLSPLDKQEEIVEILNRIEKLIDYKRQVIQKLQELIKARFVEMFGNPILNDKRWITSSIEDTCIEIYGGGTPSKQHPEYYENGSIPWVTSKDMKCDVICDSQIHINEKGLENSTARMVPTNSIVMVIRSGILKHTLPVAVNTVPITVNQDLKVFIPDSQKIMSRFFALQLKMHERDILSGVRAVTADNIEFNELKKRKIIIPPLVLQQLFIDFLIQIDKSKVAVQQSLDKTQMLFDSLMQQYFG